MESPRTGSRQGQWRQPVLARLVPGSVARGAGLDGFTELGHNVKNPCYFDSYMCTCTFAAAAFFGPLSPVG